MAADLSNPVDVTEISKAHAVSNTIDEKNTSFEKEIGTAHDIQEIQPSKELSAGDAEDAELNKSYPTDEEFNTLRRVPGSLRWPAYTVAFVELCERFSYYGTTTVCEYLPFVIPCISTKRSQLSTSSSVRAQKIHRPVRVSIELYLVPLDWDNKRLPG